jgi:hypothetical protein
MFGKSDGVRSFIEKPVVILFYIALVIACFTGVLKDFYHSIENKEHQTFGKIIFWFQEALSMIYRIVF